MIFSSEMSFPQAILIFIAFLGLAKLSLRWEKLGRLVIAAFAIRCLFAFLDQDYLSLPWSGSDSAKFYRHTLEYANSSVSRALTNIPLSSSMMFPWTMSWIGRAFGTQYKFLVCFNVLLGTFNVIQVYVLSREFLPEKWARTAAAFVCFFPVCAFLSCVYLRETLITTLILESIIRFIRGVNFATARNYYIFVVTCFCAALFHGALIALLLVVPLSYWIAIKMQAIQYGRFYRSPVLILVLSLLSLSCILAFGPRLSKVGDPTEAFERFTERQQRESRINVVRDSDYPLLLMRNIYRPDIAFLRYCYFMFAPFPWSWRGLPDVMATSFGLINAAILYLSYRHRKGIGVFPLMLVVMVVIITVLFSTSTNNVGTAIRHRNKFVPVFAAAGLAVYVYRRKLLGRDDPMDHVNPSKFPTHG